eukprot:SAG31_NODE_457_length_15415_cov_4.380387_18_plen_80_part_00
MELGWNAAASPAAAKLLGECGWTVHINRSDAAVTVGTAAGTDQVSISHTISKYLEVSQDISKHISGWSTQLRGLIACRH